MKCSLHSKVVRKMVTMTLAIDQTDLKLSQHDIKLYANTKLLNSQVV